MAELALSAALEVLTRFKLMCVLELELGKAYFRIVMWIMLIG